ncbi:hypothetical protein Zmor_023592 [Zophobas morio]|uniref:Uncharacterized protein n=1 Tax=Zophobas morio TaxID=2755281 RepID=A0AA38HZH7_9CUCU|nr:hypothetical protein Zmor_023592 [Zophobas morio]
MAFVILVLIFFSQYMLTIANKPNCVDYYWRDYYGVIPNDAVPAGKDHNGDTLYIGLIYVRGFELLPGTIFPKQESARTSAYASVFNTDKFVKILCSPHKEAFEWISIESKDLHKYMNRNPIPGGSEVGENLHVGRVFRNNDVIVGKIFRHDRVVGNGIWFPVGNTVSSSLSYDILLYNCDKIAVPKIDQRIKTY